MATSPKIENKDNLESFLKDEPMNIINNEDYNDVPLMMGYNDKEGLFVGFLHHLQGKNFSITDTSKMIPHSFHICKETDKEDVIKKVNEFYYKHDQPAPNDEKFIPDFADLVSDTFFTHGIQKSIKLHSQHSKNPVYFYRFSMDTKFNMIKHVFPSVGKYAGKTIYINNESIDEYNEILGAAHLDELAYLFKPHEVTAPEEGSIGHKNVEAMTQLWTNFAKYANPTANTNSVIQNSWKPVTSDVMNYYDIGNEISVGVNPDSERYQLWESFYQTYSCRT